MIQDKEIVLGVTGGIAAYKACEVVRLLVKAQARVTVVMTSAAKKFVTPLTFETLSNNPVYTEMFPETRRVNVEHIALADKAEVVLIAPATANIIGKIAGGIADDLLSTVVMATQAPVVLAPAMNVNMWKNLVVQRNVKALKSLGYHFVEPTSGGLACGWEGTGRLAEPEEIVEGIKRALSPKYLIGKKVLVTAGPNREWLDPVRFISNPSSGKMGFAIAGLARRMGAEVTLIHGPCSVPVPSGVTAIPVERAVEMAEVVLNRFGEQDIIVKAAAVADWRPVESKPQKIKKQGFEDKMNLELTRNPDILKLLGEGKDKQFLVGFAAESQEILENAREKLQAKNLDMIVANDISSKTAGFAHDTNEIKILLNNGDIIEFPLLTKEEAAFEILMVIVRQMGLI